MEDEPSTDDEDNDDGASKPYISRSSVKRISVPSYQLKNKLSFKSSGETKHTVATTINAEIYVATDLPCKGMVTVTRLCNGTLDQSSQKSISVATLRNGGIPALIRPNKSVILGQCKRSGGGGNFHLRFGYIAPDEAPLLDVESGIFNEADEKEWLSIVENCVLSPEVPDTAGLSPRRTRFRRTYKVDQHLMKKAKSRFLVCEPARGYNPEHSTEMPGSWIRRFVTVAGLSKGFTAATIDIKTAFLLVPLPPGMQDIHVRLPKHLPQCMLKMGYKPGAVHRLQKSLYGLQESPKLFNEFLSDTLHNLGWERISGGVFKRADGSGYIIAYVDDLLCLSEDPLADLEAISRVLKCSDLLKVDETAQRHVGMEITATKDSFFFDVNK